MATRNSLLALCSVVLMAAVSANAQHWREIVPLKSTRADVERLLGPNEKSYGVIYELNSGALSIEYSSGPCRKDRRRGWNVPEDVVINFRFAATHKPQQTDLKLNRKTYRRVVDTHTGGVIYYINDKDGVMYEVQRGTVQSVEFYPPKRYQYLHCGDQPEK